jgi:hypothetical protein
VAGVAARQDAGHVSAPPQIGGQPQYTGRFARAAHGQIADADHGDIKASLAVELASLAAASTPHPDARQRPPESQPGLGRPVAWEAGIVELAGGGDRTPGGAPLGFGCGPPAISDLVGTIRGVEQPLDRARQFSGSGDFDRSARGAQIRGNGLKVLHVRTGNDGLGKQRRLDRVVTASAGERPSHENYVCDGKKAA